jgi:hypothetical protein
MGGILTVPSAAEIREIWGGEIRPIQPDLIDSRVPAEIRDFLTTIGLPTGDAQAITFLHDQSLPVHTWFDRDYVKIAESFDHYPFAVDLETGRVALARPSRDVDPRFVNSGLAQFAYCLGSFERDVDAYVLEAPSDERRRHAVDRFREMLAERDPVAAADEKNYWPGVLTNVLEC